MYTEFSFKEIKVSYFSGFWQFVRVQRVKGSNWGLIFLPFELHGEDFINETYQNLKLIETEIDFYINIGLRNNEHLKCV